MYFRKQKILETSKIFKNILFFKYFIGFSLINERISFGLMGAWRFGSIRRQVLMIKEVWVYFFEDFINSENMRVWLQGDHLEKSMTLNIKKAIEIKFQPLIKSRENFSLTLSRFCHQAQYFLNFFLKHKTEFEMLSLEINPKAPEKTFQRLWKFLLSVWIFDKKGFWISRGKGEVNSREKVDKAEFDNSNEVSGILAFKT